MPNSDPTEQIEYWDRTLWPVYQQRKDIAASNAKYSSAVFCSKSVSTDRVFYIRFSISTDTVYFSEWHSDDPASRVESEYPLDKATDVYLLSRLESLDARARSRV